MDEYVPHYLEIKWINDDIGRGIFTKRDIAFGEIILIEKHIASGESAKNFTFGVQDHALHISHDSSSINVQQSLLNIYENGTTIQKYRLSLLHGSKKFNKETHVCPSMDVFRYDKLPSNVSINEIKILSMHDIKCISKWNAFTGVQMSSEIEKEILKNLELNEPIMRLETGDLPKKSEQSSSDIFVLASLFNHSDTKPNVLGFVMNSRIYIIAIEDIKKGEELTHHYGYDPRKKI